ncbi:MAG: M24 family metallopeptidase [Promethearchaeota archaeon]
MQPITNEKFDLLLEFMDENNLDVLLIKDSESSHDVNLHYLSGHPMDATLLITATGETTLIPWDIPLAEEHAEVDSIIDPSNYEYSDVKIFTEFFNKTIKKSSFTLGTNENLPYTIVILLETEIPNIKVFREPKKIYNLLQELRKTKSDPELKNLREAAKIGSKAINDIQKFVENATNETENDLSFLVRKKLAEYGADDLAFQSLVGNTARSHLIHCHPRSSNQQLAKPGLALIDFGANYKGYNSDITVPISFGSLSEEQQKMKDLTLKAYEASIEIIDIGVPLWKIDEAARTIMKNGDYEMPHSLGHGLGLTVHDAPGIRRKPTDTYQLKYWQEDVIEEGMVFTIEPGCYKAGLGGQRLENDVLINHNGKVEVITGSHFIDIQ